MISDRFEENAQFVQGWLGSMQELAPSHEADDYRLLNDILTEGILRWKESQESSTSYSTKRIPQVKANDDDRQE